MVSGINQKSALSATYEAGTYVAENICAGTILKATTGFWGMTFSAMVPSAAVFGASTYLAKKTFSHLKNLFPDYKDPVVEIAGYLVTTLVATECMMLVAPEPISYAGALALRVTALGVHIFLVKGPQFCLSGYRNYRLLKWVAETPEDELKRRFEIAFKEVGLKEDPSKQPLQSSGGELIRQRVDAERL